MNNIMIFENKKVEVFEYKGQVLFNPYHCGECLELADSSIRDLVRKMNDKQVVKLKNSDVVNSNIRKLNNAGENFLTESGVYKLIFKSKKKEAERFQDWVTDEVLPSIRKTGSYTMLENRVELLINDIVKSKINEIEKKCSEYYKINDIKKKHISQYIKNRLGIKRTNNEYEQVKERVFLLLGVKKWEEIDMETFKNSINIIDESIRVIKMERPYEQIEFKV